MYNVPVMEEDEATDDLSHPAHHKPLVKTLLHDHMVEQLPSTSTENAGVQLV